MGVLQDNLVLSTELIMWIGHRKEIRDSLQGRANARNVSFRISLRWPIHIINPVDKTKLSVACSYFELVFARCIASPYCLGSLWFWFKALIWKPPLFLYFFFCLMASCKMNISTVTACLVKSLYFSQFNNNNVKLSPNTLQHLYSISSSI